MRIPNAKGNNKKLGKESKVKQTPA